MRFTLAIASLLLAGCPAPSPSDTGAADAEVDGRPDRAPVGGDVSAPDAVGTDAVAPDALAPDGASADARFDVFGEASPDVVPDAPGDGAARLTTLRVRYAPTTGSVALRGSVTPLTWERGVTFRRVADDTWEWSSTDLSTPLEWKPLLADRTWSRGPNYRARPGATVEVFPHFNTVQGAFARTHPSVRSTVLGNTRGVWIYLPPTYEENRAARFPVVYMHDGQNLFDPRAAFGGVAWDVDGAMDGGAESASIREAIIVGVENNASRIDEYTPTADASVRGGGRGDLYLRFLIEELKPMIDRTYRTLPGPESTAVVGSSLGGLISLYAGVRRPDVFGIVGALSPSTWWDGRVILREVMSLAGRPVRPLRVYVDSGDAGASRDGVDDTRELAAALRTAGYVEGSSLRYVVQPGGQHSERYWAMRLPTALSFVLGTREATAP